MDAGVRKRMFALFSLLFILIQVPFAELEVPAGFDKSNKTGKIPMSVLQVAVSSFHEGKKIPEPVLKATMAPGLLAHDVYTTVICKLGDTEVCNVPKALPQYENLFQLTSPLCNPKAIQILIKKNFSKTTELIQAGAALVVGAAVMSLIYPIKFGFFGYLMILYAMVKESIIPFLPGLAFVPIFAVATDIGSMFRRQRAPPPAASAAATGAAGQGGAAKEDAAKAASKSSAKAGGKSKKKQ